MQRWDGLGCVGLQKVWMGECVMGMVGRYARGIGRHRIESQEVSNKTRNWYKISQNHAAQSPRWVEPKIIQSAPSTSTDFTNLEQCRGGRARVDRIENSALGAVCCRCHRCCTPADRRPRTRRTSDVNRRESRTGRRSSRASSDGSCVQPSIGIPLAWLTV